MREDSSVLPIAAWASVEAISTAAWSIACAGRSGGVTPVRKFASSRAALIASLYTVVEFALRYCQASSAQLEPEETSMAMEIGHVHIKTYDPKKTAQFYIENFGATMKNEAPNGNIQLDLHGLQLNVTTISAAQNRKQMMGIEHIALQTDDYAGAVAKLRSNGAHIMLEQFNHRRDVA